MSFLSSRGRQFLAIIVIAILALCLTSCSSSKNTSLKVGDKYGTIAFDSQDSLSWMSYSVMSDWEKTDFDYDYGPAVCYETDSYGEIIFAINEQCWYENSLEKNLNDKHLIKAKFYKTVEYVAVDMYAGSVYKNYNSISKKDSKSAKLEEGDFVSCTCNTPYGVVQIICQDPGSDFEKAQATIEQLAASISFEPGLMENAPTRYDFVGSGLSLVDDFYSFDEAINHVGEGVVGVYGMVDNVYYAENANGTPTFINFGNPETSACFCGVVWGENTRYSKKELESFEGETVCLTGTIKSYVNSYGVEEAEIMLAVDGQIKKLYAYKYLDASSVDEQNQKLIDEAEKEKKENNEKFERLGSDYHD